MGCLIALGLSGVFNQAFAANEDSASETVVIKKKPNEGDLRYPVVAESLSKFAQMFHTPRVIDFVQQMSLVDLSPREQDAFLMPTWNVAIVSDEAELDLPVIRGGYFSLPLEQPRELRNATIMFNAQTRKRYLNTAWTIRTPNDHLRYKDFAQAFEDVRTVQKQIPWYSLVLRTEKRDQFNALKACFPTSDGTIQVDGKDVASITSANCKIYAFDPSLASSEAAISFAPHPEIVVLENTARY
jgi:hypothetical protein